MGRDGIAESISRRLYPLQGLVCVASLLSVHGVFEGSPFSPERGAQAPRVISALLTLAFTVFESLERLALLSLPEIEDYAITWKT